MYWSELNEKLYYSCKFLLKIVDTSHIYVVIAASMDAF